MTVKKALKNRKIFTPPRFLRGLEKPSPQTKERERLPSPFDLSRNGGFKQSPLRFHKPGASGFTLIGVLVASTVGAVVVTGLSQMSVNILRGLEKTQRNFHLIELSEEIKRAFEAPSRTGCSDPDNCRNACSNSLYNYDNSAGVTQGMAIKYPSSVPGNFGTAVYQGGQSHKGVKIREIRFQARDGKGATSTTVDRDGNGAIDSSDVRVNPVALVFFSLSADSREVLSAPRPLEFEIHVTKYLGSGNRIKECRVAGGGMVSGGGGVPDCYQAGTGEKTIIGCGGAIQNPSNDITAFGYKAGSSANTGTRNTFIGWKAGIANSSGSNNTLVGAIAGEAVTTGSNNTLIGVASGYRITSGIHNTVVGSGAGELASNRNTVVGRQAGRESVGDGNVFLGYRAGFFQTSGNQNIYIGNEAGPPSSGGGPSGITKTGQRQLNIGNLILGKIPSSPPAATPALSGTGIVIHGTIRATGNITGLSLTPSSSRVFKKNIKPFKDFEGALGDILNTPLFTYQYREDHPGKTRRGIISEELPSHLQIKDKGAPSFPDMPSVYGTFWAGIKALAARLKNFREKTLSALSDLTGRLKLLEEEFLKWKDRFPALEKRLEESAQAMAETKAVTEQNQQKILKLEEELKRLKDRVQSCEKKLNFAAPSTP